MNFFAKLSALRASATRAKDSLLDLLFPKSELVREIEEMSTQTFASRRRFFGHYPPECADWCRAVLAYRDRHVRAAVWELKYRKNIKVAKIFGELLAIELGKLARPTMQNASPFLIVPIPLSEKRRRGRGYNQIELILEHLPKSGQWTIATDLLRRKHHTTPQTKLTRAKRLKNLEDCFEVSPNSADTRSLTNKTVIVIDDVMTTGSTLRQTREALRRAGTKEVFAITIAH